MKQLEALTKRQQYIIEIIGQAGKASSAAIINETKKHFDNASRITVIRDLNVLLEKKLLLRKGKGRSVTYESAFPFLLKFFDIERYFSEEPDRRAIQQERFGFKPERAWNLIITDEEINDVRRLTDLYRKHRKRYDANILRKELERITIEFSWKSSHLEGNTYTLLDTERLILEQKEAAGKKREEAIMILNHKEALTYAWQHARDFRIITRRSIEELHDLLAANLDVKKGLRKHPVGITGTAYKPHDNVFQIREAIEGLCRLINNAKNPVLKALIAVAGLSYIQPFEDGNKRTARLLGNALLLAYDYCPLSYRSVDESEYKKTLLIFYEQHTILHFKKLFLEQYKFAVENYFL